MTGIITQVAQWWCGGHCGPCEVTGSWLLGWVLKKASFKWKVHWSFSDNYRIQRQLISDHFLTGFVCFCHQVYKSAKGNFTDWALGVYNMVGLQICSCKKKQKNKAYIIHNATGHFSQIFDCVRLVDLFHTCKLQLQPMLLSCDMTRGRLWVAPSAATKGFFTCAVVLPETLICKISGVLL